MVFLRQLRRFFRNDGRAHVHPRGKCNQPVEILGETNTTKPFHVKYVGYSRIGSPSLSLKRASEVVRSIIRRGPRRNKERVSLIITPQEMFVRDTISRCGITLFPMDGIGMVYAPSEDSRLFGVTVKDSSSSSDFTFFLYKCTVRDSCRCQNVEIKKAYETMYEEYLGTETNVIQNIEHTGKSEEKSCTAKGEGVRNEENDVRSISPSEEKEDIVIEEIEDKGVTEFDKEGHGGESVSDVNSEETDGESEECTDENDLENEREGYNEEIEDGDNEEDPDYHTNEDGVENEKEDIDYYYEETDNDDGIDTEGDDDVFESEEEDPDNFYGESDRDGLESEGEDSYCYEETDDDGVINEGEGPNYYYEEGKDDENDTCGDNSYSIDEDSVTDDEDSDEEVTNYDEDSDEEVTDYEEGSDIESEGRSDAVFRSPRPTKSGFTYLSPQCLTHLTPSPPPPLPTPEDQDNVPFNSRRQPPKKRLSPYILDLIKQIEASLVEQEDHDPDKSEEETEEP